MEFSKIISKDIGRYCVSLISLFGLLVPFAPGFKARVDSLACMFCCLRIMDSSNSPLECETPANVLAPSLFFNQRSLEQSKSLYVVYSRLIRIRLMPAEVFIATCRTLRDASQRTSYELSKEQSVVTERYATQYSKVYTSKFTIHSR